MTSSTGTPLLFFFFVFLSFLLSEGKGGSLIFSPAPNCARYECPQYSVVHSENNFEIRAYTDALWVSSPRIQANSYLEAANKGFRILFDYYKGSNSQYVNISLTTPVLVDIRSKFYKIYFYVPQKYQKSLPRPLSGSIEQVRLPILKYVAVRRFSGFATDQNLPLQSAFLEKSIKGTPYRRAAAPNQTTLAVYNAPFQPKKRVNEVLLWFDRLA